MACGRRNLLVILRPGGEYSRFLVCRAEVVLELMDIYGYNVVNVNYWFFMNKYTTSASTKQILRKIDSLQQKIVLLRPLHPDLLMTLQEKLRIEWTYNSNAIEGNTLTLGETMFFLREGLTSEGRPLHDYLEARNHAEAIDGLEEIIKDGRDITESLIKQLHSVLMKGIEFTYARASSGQIVHKPFQAGQYKSQPNHVLTLTGQVHHYSEPLKVKDDMEALIKWYHSRKRLHPLELAAIFHYRFVAIHPFSDGNGRMARLLMNLILMKNGFPPCVIQNSSRRKYLEVLESVDRNRNYSLFVDWLGEQLWQTQRLMEEVLHGRKSVSDSAVGGERVGRVSLNEFQRNKLIMDVMKRESPLAIGGISESIPDIKRPTLKKDLKKLLNAGLIRAKGSGKGVVYFL